MQFTLTISVHELVDFLFRTGDIDNRVFNTETMSLGSKLHSAYQKSQNSSYLSEYFLSSTFKVGEFSITIEGRADGIILDKGKVTIDEIKTTVEDLNVFFENNYMWNLNQAICYAFMYCEAKNIDNCSIKLTYISQNDSSIKLVKDFSFDREYLAKQVNSFVNDYINEKLLANIQHSRSVQDNVKLIKFPYGFFRKGQKELINEIIFLAKHGGIKFIEAPTGIGKTISCLFPFVRGFSLDKFDKVFYLTAKSSGKEAAKNCLDLLIDNGFTGRYVILTARDKICPNTKAECNPDSCPFAKNYYTNLRNNINEAIKLSNRFDPNFIMNFCLDNSTCPFEFQLDLSNYCDIVISDYNYLLDPISHLQRYFDPSQNCSRNVLLIDEAHNLIDRCRNMFSASLSLKEISDAKRDIKNSRRIKNQLTKLLTTFEQFSSVESFTALESFSPDILTIYERLKKVASEEAKNKKITLPESYKLLSKDLNKFKVIFENYFNNQYSVFVRKEKNNITLSMYCLDASSFVNEVIEKSYAAVLFSATLSPMTYYIKTILGRDDITYKRIDSPFDSFNQKILITSNISTRYKDRKDSIGSVINMINEFTSSKVGNYFVYCPSYEYLDLLRNNIDENFCKSAQLYFQEKDMTNFEHQNFLEKFDKEEGFTKIAFIILGGVFSEGIEMTNSDLSGVVVIGVGLSQINEENNLIKQYYDENGIDGFDYAYINPGINRVMQAVGRLIRNENHRGMVLLIDNRYLRNPYRKLFNGYWSNFEIINEEKEITQFSTSFYKNNKKSL